MPASTRAHATQRRALEREAEHLQVGHVEPPPELGRAAPELRSLRGLATSVRHDALEEGKPTMLGPGLERVEQAMGSSQPPATANAPWKSR
jgi:hypothetical protein